MSKIHETAIAICECLEVQKLADERSVGKMEDVLGDRDNAQQVCSDAGFLVHTFEQELTAYTPDGPADMLTQVLVLAAYFNSHAMVEGSETERTVRLLIGRLLEGLVELAGRDASPLFDKYFNPKHTWAGRVAAVENSAKEMDAGEPIAAA